ncbi:MULTISPECIES: alpha/beta fold hydrolase [Variovorax]|uniref:alpha/beta fold hydrolase n=1 Tax=Variovorax TaxID=34072 RepID=UPI000869E0DB|nr:MULTISPECIES: alpha/beta hydrolase [Variovorax]MBN8754366.1 lysophospholipase [Variovorax sp.]ODU17591.1 MAG: alpha/beta hydrolase [Variovorax sp. SCN 67-85]ODV25929.1 MAG: alpha/beta hydrolase [Variovorax sp. SCN 67-20]OJZ03982.1 MAG: alpha/beta hydrolase [Variovorax sp. 67-131]UKI10150.1 alpha/beta hydrolase [Variovorax paradoxus]
MPSTETHFDLTSNDGVPIEAHRWQGPTQRAVIQLAHGMGEHSLRYRHLAKALVEAGYVVYGNEHRGHGKGAAARDELGEFGPRGFGGLVDDMALLSRHVRGVHPGLPLILLGHSMGSFATQYYLVKHSDLLSGAVLSGTSALDLLGGALQSGFKLEDMNAALPDVRTPFDWLSRDAAQVDAYIADPLCGFTVSAEGMGSMFAGLAELEPAAMQSRIRPDLPLYLFIGDQDPVSNKAEWFHPLVQRYREAGLRDVSSHVFGGARHETLNEVNREEVVAVLLAWIARVVTAASPKKP